MDYKAEEILNQVQQIYSGVELKGKNLKIGAKSGKNLQNLEEIGRDELFQLYSKISMNDIKRFITRPSKNLTVLVIGNHSAGKSSFINWFVEEKVQSTGIAIETSHFTMIRYGEKKVEIQSEGTLALYPFFREIMNQSRKEVYGKFFANLTTKTCTSKVRNIERIDFIDTPGLTDGKVDYECDILEMIKWVSSYVDAILVFLDPIGQALCTKTMDMIEYLYSTYKTKVIICLTKIDQIDPADLNKLSMQIYSSIITRTQNIHLEVIPISTAKDYSGPNNKISKLLEKFTNFFNDKAMRNIEIMTLDCHRIIDHCNQLIKIDESNKTTAKICKGFKYLIIFFQLILLVLMIAIFVKFEPEISFEVPSQKYMIGLIAAHVLLAMFFFVISRFQKDSFNSMQIAKVNGWISYCKNAIVEGEKMTQDYLNS